MTEGRAPQDDLVTAPIVEKRTVSEILARAAFAAEVLDRATVNAKGLAAAAWTVRAIDGELRALVDDGALARRRDLVKDAVRVIVDLVTTGRSPLVDDLMRDLPSGLLDVRRVSGLGPKKVRALYTTLGITSLAELEYACRENRLVELKGFGPKTQGNVLSQVLLLRAEAGQLRLDEARALGAEVVARLRALGARAELAGAARRAEELVDEVVVVVAVDAREVDAVRRAYAPPSTTSEGDDDGARARDARAPLRVVEVSDAAFATTLLFETGSSAHLALLVEHARALGLALDASGLSRAGVVVDTREEDDVYRALGLVPTTPERREAGVPLVFEGHATPRLVAAHDLQGALHTHTRASDGNATISEMRAAARARGLAYLAITDHSAAAAYAGGLDAARVRTQRDEIARLRSDGDDVGLLSGIESDILRDGHLDLDDDTLASLDIVVASVHQRHAQDGATLLARVIAALAHPCADVLGHPTGRLLLGRRPMDLDMDTLFAACARHETVVELNAQPARLDLDATHLARAREHGLLVSIAPDAHAPDALAYLDLGVAVARRAGLTCDDVLNARPLDEVQAIVTARRAHRRAREVS